MSNSNLYQKLSLKIPNNILEYIQKVKENNPKHLGIKRAEFILQNTELTYSNAKRIKNYFDSYDNSENKDEITYNLYGGDLMKNFINTNLKNSRKNDNTIKNVKGLVDNNSHRKRKPVDSKIKINNNFKKNDFLRDLKPKTNLFEDKNIYTNSSTIVVIRNQENKILLLRRSDNDYWMAGHWGYPGGMIDKGEKPIQGAIRETYEEAGLIVSDIKFISEILSNNTNLYIFKGSSNSEKVKLSHEHSEYGWFSIEEIKNLDKKTPNIEKIAILTK
jgi:8-oxo-dGTP pyrophosphatase MutT (NUDIX family)